MACDIDSGRTRDTSMTSSVLKIYSSRSSSSRQNLLRSFSSNHPPTQTIEDVESRVVNGKRNALNFSLSGTGPAFFSWMSGFCHGLQEKRLVTKDSNFVGLSGGAMCSFFLAAGLDFSAEGDVMRCGQHQSERVRERKNDLSQLVAHMAEDLISDDMLPDLLDKTNVSVAMAPGRLPGAYSRRILLHTQFTSKKDLVDSLTAATHLPYMSNGAASTVFRGREVVDAGCTGQMFVPVKGFQHVNILPPCDYVPENENALGRLFVGTYAKLCNKAEAPVHAHPYMAKDFRLGIFGVDDLMLKPIVKDEALRRHRLGYEACAQWFETRKKSNEWHDDKH